MDSVVEDEAGIEEELLVSPRGLVEVGVNAWPTETRDLHVVTCDDPRRICDHAGGADHARGFTGGRARGEDCSESEKEGWEDSDLHVLAPFACFVDRAVFSRLAVTLAGLIIADLYYPRVIKMA
jgi:hypothetical protein